MNTVPCRTCSDGTTNGRFSLNDPISHKYGCPLISYDDKCKYEEVFAFARQMNNSFKEYKKYKKSDIPLPDLTKDFPYTCIDCGIHHFTRYISTAPSNCEFGIGCSTCYYAIASDGSVVWYSDLDSYEDYCAKSLRLFAPCS